MPDRGDHEHLWQLPDGTGLHAPYSTLAVDPQDGRLFCHLCGNGFRHLGAHVRVHNLTAAQYRELLGLRATVALVTSSVSAAISVRQSSAYAAQREMRERLAPGRALAEAGALSWLARRGPQSPQRVRERREQLAVGRATRAAATQARLGHTVRASGAEDLAGFLRARYGAGASLETLARETGLGRQRLRDALTDAGVAVRAPGHNTTPGRHSRAVSSKAVAAARVGTCDIRGWLAEQHSGGTSISRLAVEVGRSTGWVRARLAPEGVAGTG